MRGVHGGQQRGHDTFPSLLTTHPFSQFILCVCIIYLYLSEDLEDENIESASHFFTVSVWFWSFSFALRFGLHIKTLFGTRVLAT